MVVRYGKNTCIKDDTIYFTPDMNFTIEEYENCRDLGIQLCNDGYFSIHMENIIKKVRRLIGWVLRSFMDRSINFMKKMWNAIIRPHLDYCAQLWAPPEGPLLDNLEKLQYNFTGLIPELRNLEYCDRLKKLGMYSVQRRLDRY